MRPKTRAAVYVNRGSDLRGRVCLLFRLYPSCMPDCMKTPLWMKKLRNSEDCSPKTSWAAAFAYCSTSGLPDPSSISGPAEPSRNQVTGRNSRGTMPSCLNFGYPRITELLMLQG